MRRVTIVITARASFARVATVIEALRQHEAHGQCVLDLVWAGSAVLREYGDVSLPGDRRITNVIAGTTLEGMAAETGLLVIHLAAEFARTRPDVVVTIADRHETIATAIAASYQNVMLCHVQGGESTGSIDDRVRAAVSMLSDAHFPATVNAAQRLVLMGVRGPVFLRGCPSVDLAARTRPGYVTEPRPLVVLSHAVTDEPTAYRDTLAVVEAVRQHDGPVCWIWPGEDAGGGEANRAIRTWANEHPAHVTFRRHIPALEFLGLLWRSCAIVGNSSVGVRECSYIGLPAVNVGTRQQGRERGPNVLDVPPDTDAIITAIREQVAHGHYESSQLYGDGHAGAAIARDLLEVEL